MMKAVIDHEGVSGVPEHFNSEYPAILRWQESVSEAIPIKTGTMDGCICMEAGNYKGKEFGAPMAYICTMYILVFTRLHDFSRESFGG